VWRGRERGRGRGRGEGLRAGKAEASLGGSAPKGRLRSPLGYHPPMPPPQIHILICLNERPAESPKPSCAVRGSLAVYHRFKDRVKELGIRDRVMVTRPGCLKHCSQGITVAVWPFNLWYRAVTLEDVEEILQRTVLEDGREVERLRMPDIPWE
jgi:(2Fe-2S) ferredoxin